MKKFSPREPAPIHTNSSDSLATQLPLFDDDVYAVFGNMVNLLGGARYVGHCIWPDRDMDDAEQRLLHCLNKKRTEKFALHEQFQIIAMARAANIRVFADYFARNFDYEVREITRQEKAAKLQETVQALTVQLGHVVRELEKMK